jgi:hypothetical protein
LSSNPTKGTTEYWFYLVGGFLVPRRRTPISEQHRSLQKSYASNVSWSKTDDRSERTRKAREAYDAKLLAEAGGDPQKAKTLRKMHMQRMLLKSIEVRKAKRAAAEAEAAGP